MISDYKDLFRNKNFVYLWISQVLSQLTINLINFLLIVTLFQKTGSTIATSFIWVAYAIPALIVGPIAAASVDMIDNKKVLVVTNLFQSLTILIYAFSYRTSLFLLYGVVVIYSLLNQFYVPAELASLPQLVKKAKLPHANGLLLITQQATIILGFGFAGLLNELVGFTKTLYLGSALLLFAFVSVLRLPEMKKAAKFPKGFEDVSIAFYKSIIEGYTFIRSNNFVLAPLAILLYLNMVIVVVSVNFPAIATEIFRIPINLSGVILALPGGFGAALAALTVPKILQKKSRKISVIKLSFLFLSFSFFLVTFIIPLFNNLPRIIVSVLSLTLLGYAFVGIVIPTQTFFQINIPKKLRGRVLGNYWFLSTVVSIFPVIFSGTITEIFGIKVLLLLMGASAFALFYAIRSYAAIILNKGFLSIFGNSQK